jgi:hypothetical protein
MPRNAYHTRTGFACQIVARCTDSSGVRYFCNFLGRANPFCWVKAEELTILR